MAITATNLIASTSGSYGFSPTTFTTASVTTVTGRLYIMPFCINFPGGSSSVPTSVSNSLGITWSTISNGTGVKVFYGICTAGATGTFTVTGNSYGNTTQYCLDEIAGITSTGFIVQSANTATATMQQSASTTLTSTLSAFGNVNNAVYMIGGLGTAPSSSYTTSSTVKTGYTQLAKDTTNFFLTTEFLASNDTTPNIVYGQDNSVFNHCTYAGISFELKAYIPITDAYTTTVTNSLMLMGSGI